ncbi:MAG: hypothetical protein ISQ87_08745 [Rhodobacteraceae bacterium]|nr:hypothetical protein [Paracoccaceae bacterium]MBL6788758.1 hypothetical protein [Paracoccaceae bacterium]MBL6860054.1 hypothetical protein [Paracoccaceae bacterium]
MSGLSSFGKSTVALRISALGPIKIIRLFDQHQALAALPVDLCFLLTRRGYPKQQSVTISAVRFNNMQSLEGLQARLEPA